MSKLRNLLLNREPSVHIMYDFIETTSIHEDIQRMKNESTLNDSSRKSEIKSFELIQHMLSTKTNMARLMETEGQIVYQSERSKKTDFSFEFEGKLFGVQVTRAFRHPYKPGIRQIKQLILKKMDGIIKSTSEQAGCRKWEKQILHVWTKEEEDLVDVVRNTFEEAREEQKSNTILLITQLCPEQYNEVF